jgi:tryptophan-rich sensory protein
MKNLPKLIISVVGCELVGYLGTPFTISAIPTWYATLNKPFFAPPNWIFGPVWTMLYFLMGVAFYLIWKQDRGKSAKGRSASGGKKKVRTAGMFFLAQLGLNFIWSPIFFGFRSPLIALIVIVTMWVLIVMTMKKFYPLSRLAFYLLIPYLLWVSFATLLNAAIVILN